MSQHDLLKVIRAELAGSLVRNKSITTGLRSEGAKHSSPGNRLELPCSGPSGQNEIDSLRTSLPVYQSNFEEAANL